MSHWTLSMRFPDGRSVEVQGDYLIEAAGDGVFDKADRAAAEYGWKPVYQAGEFQRWEPVEGRNARQRQVQEY